MTTLNLSVAYINHSLPEKLSVDPLPVDPLVVGGASLEIETIIIMSILEYRNLLVTIRQLEQQEPPRYVTIVKTAHTASIC